MIEEYYNSSNYKLGMIQDNSLVLVIVGSGRIGRNFCLYAIENTNYNIINIDPASDSLIQKKLETNERYFHIKIPIGKLDSAKQIIDKIKNKYPEKLTLY